MKDVRIVAPDPSRPEKPAAITAIEMLAVVGASSSHAAPPGRRLAGMASGGPAYNNRLSQAPVSANEPVSTPSTIRTSPQGLMSLLGSAPAGRPRRS